MLNVKIGDTLMRITPPYERSRGDSQAGAVGRVTDDLIERVVQVDIPRRMRFSRLVGRHTAGLGTFVVRSDIAA